VSDHDTTAEDRTQDLTASYQSSPRIGGCVYLYGRDTTIACIFRT
jgi:hypothetical protein